MELQEFFAEQPRAALAFSGGVDSAYLLYAAKHYGADVKAYYVRSAFQPEFEYQDALRLARRLEMPMQVIKTDVLSCEEVTENPKNRCYFCKKQIFSAIAAAAAADGYTVILDGTNASDDEGDRPGMQALRELEVKSPLRLCGLTKQQIREKSRQAGLFTWDKPAYACLATRIPTGDPITAEKLRMTEDAESYLADLGFSDFRVRYLGGAAKLQLKQAQLPMLFEHREEILTRLKQDYSSVLLDLEVRK